MKNRALGKWYVKSVVKLDNQSDDFILFENLKSMYISFEDDGSLIAYDSENNYNGNFFLEYDITGPIFESGRLKMEFIDKTDFSRWNYTAEEEQSLIRASDVIENLLNSDAIFQHRIKDEDFQIITSEYLIIFQRKRIFHVDYPRERSLLSTWLG